MQAVVTASNYRYAFDGVRVVSFNKGEVILDPEAAATAVKDGAAEPVNVEVTTQMATPVEDEPVQAPETKIADPVIETSKPRRARRSRTQ